MKNWVLFALVFCPTIFAKSFKEDLTLTLDQKFTLDKFRDIVRSRLPHDYMHEDVYLMRWLRAKDWNILEAENFLMKNLRWREENKIDQIHDENWDDFMRDFHYSLDGRDKEGKPLLYLNAGDVDMRRAFVTGRIERFSRFVDMSLDRACSLVRDLGHKYKNVSQGVLMLNLEGFNLVQHTCLRCVPTLLRIVISYENHHPGCVDKVFLVYTPQIFEPLLTAARPLLSKETSEALRIIGTNKKVVKETLFKYFDRDQLPYELGGTASYGDWEDYNN